MWYGIVNYSHHAVHYIPRSYNWKLVPFDQPQNTLRTPANMKISTVTWERGGVGAPIYCSWGYKLENWNSHFGRHFERIMVEDRHTLEPTIPLLEMCAYVCQDMNKNTYKTIIYNIINWKEPKCLSRVNEKWIVVYSSTQLWYIPQCKWTTITTT